MPNVLTGVNPLTRLAVIILVTTPLLLSVDWVSAAVSLVITLLCAPLCGVSWWRLLKMSWPLFIIAPISGISMLLYAQEGGREYFSFFLATVTDNSIELAVAMMLRVLAVALPVIVLARDIDPTELGDALAQILKLPARFVIGAVAGVRMLTLFKDDWQAMGQARRARGLADRGRISHLVSMTFGQDPQTFKELVFMIRELVDEGITVASITHDELFINALADAHLVVSAHA